MFAYDMIPAICIIMRIAHHPVTESIALLTMNVPPSRVPADALVLRGAHNTLEQEVNDRTTHGGGLRESCDARARMSTVFTP